ncbi:MAG TPA: hypothetical protein VL944_02220 [Candidatus Acidoferrum sp.]|nr:hypothetical protein [Candidatus Acidoferrum sp.]
MNAKGAVVYATAAILMLSVLTQISGATYINMLEPFNYTVSGVNSTVYLGKDGPGQTFYVTISAATANSTGIVNNLAWNKFVVSGLPAGWIAANSSLYNPTLSVKITPSPNAQNGSYSFNLTAVNVGNYSKFGALRFTAVVNVTPNVFKLNVTPSTVYESTGTPTDIYVSINNTGVSDSLFQISITGVPAYNITQSVIALHHSEEKFTYPVTVSQPGVYSININVSSTSSPLVHKQTSVTLITKATILGDYFATGGGIVSFPIIYEPVYAVMYLISKLFSL